MDIDDYSRDRSRSPVRDRSRSPARDRDGYGSRGRGARRGRGRGRGRRDDRRPRDDEEYRTKIDRNYDNSVFVGNIPFDAGSDDLRNIFGEFSVVRADIVTNRGRSRGMATVEFGSKEEVAQAIQKFDHFDYHGREIFVRQDYPPPSDKRREPPQREPRDREPRDRFRPPRERPPPADLVAPEPGTEVFIGNLPFTVSWQTLKDLMREIGDVTRADVKLDKFGRSKGFGTVVFSSVEEADKAIEHFNGYELEGRHLETRPGKGDYRVREKPVEDNKNSEFTAGAEGEGEASNTIYVANLPWVTSVDDLFDLFETIGKVVRAEIQYNNRGRASGNAVVEFEVQELAELAISNLNGYNYGGRDLAISYVKRQDPETQAADAMEDAPAPTQETPNADA